MRGSTMGRKGNTCRSEQSPRPNSMSAEAVHRAQQKMHGTHSNSIRPDLPHDMELERCALGALLFGARDERVSIKHFHSECHQNIFRAIESLACDGNPVDAILVTRKMLAMGLEWKIGAITKILETVPAIEHLAVYVDGLIDLHRRRRAIRAAEFLVRNAYDPTCNIEHAWSKIQGEL